MGRLLMIFLIVLALGAQGRRGERADGEPALPNGKSQKREILKADREKSKEEAAELVEMAQQLKEDIEKTEYQVLDLRLVKKAEDIEKLAKRIKDRMKRYY